MKKYLLIVLFSTFFLLNGDYAQAETKGTPFYGIITAVDCKSGAISMTFRKKEMTFELAPDTFYRNITGCGEISAGRRALIHYETKDGKNRVLDIKVSFLSVEPVEGKNSFAGTVAGVDCAESALNARSAKKGETALVETFYLSPDTKFLDIKECKDIATGMITFINFEEKEGKKIITEIKAKGINIPSGKEMQ
jgi:hypothetical protein